jgi:hypothetical protein
MLKKLFVSALVALAISMSAGVGSAQFLDLSHIVQRNMLIDQQFYPWAWQQSVQIAKARNGAPLPFNAMTIHQANNQANAAWNGYNQNWHKNSALTSKAISNWTDGAINQLGYFQNPANGNLYQQPWAQNGYHVGQYGYVYPGLLRHGYGANLYPYYGK